LRLNSPKVHQSLQVLLKSLEGWALFTRRLLLLEEVEAEGEEGFEQERILNCHV
jgi:hypothetical protein